MFLLSVRPFLSAILSSDECQWVKDMEWKHSWILEINKVTICKLVFFIRVKIGFFIDSQEEITHFSPEMVTIELFKKFLFSCTD